MPDFLDPVKLIGYFGAWALMGLLVVVFIESGVLFPVLPGDTLLFVGGHARRGHGGAAPNVGPEPTSTCGSCWCSSPSPRSSAARSGTGSAAASARRCSRRTRASSSSATSTRRTRSSSSAAHSPSCWPGSSRSCGRWRRSPRAPRRWATAVFTLFNVIGAVVWGVGLILLGYWLGQFAGHPEAARADLHPHRTCVDQPDGLGVVQTAQGGRERETPLRRPKSRAEA